MLNSPWKQRPRQKPEHGVVAPKGEPRAARPGWGGLVLGPAQPQPREGSAEPGQAWARVPHPQQPSSHQGAGTRVAPDRTPGTPLPLPADPVACPGHTLGSVSPGLRAGGIGVQGGSRDNPGLAIPQGQFRTRALRGTWAGLAEQVLQEEQADGSGASYCLSGASLMTQVEATWWPHACAEGQTPKTPFPLLWLRAPPYTPSITGSQPPTQKQRVWAGPTLLLASLSPLVPAAATGELRPGPCVGGKVPCVSVVRVLTPSLPLAVPSRRKPRRQRSEVGALVRSGEGVEGLCAEIIHGLVSSASRTRRLAGQQG